MTHRLLRTAALRWVATGALVALLASHGVAQDTSAGDKPETAEERAKRLRREKRAARREAKKQAEAEAKQAEADKANKPEATGDTSAPATGTAAPAAPATGTAGAATGTGATSGQATAGSSQALEADGKTTPGAQPAAEPAEAIPWADEAELPSFLQTVDKRIKDERAAPTAEQVAALGEMEREFEAFTQRSGAHRDTVTAILRRAYQRERRERTEAYARQMLQTNPHSPAHYRINAVVRNFDEWYKAFKVTPDDDLYLPPAERVRIW